jgi:hypothetical protein
MLLKRRSDGHLLEVQDLQQLFSVFEAAVVVRDQVGEEEQDPESISKAELVFLSGEALPRCWTDPQYRDDAP